MPSKKASTAANNKGRVATTSQSRVPDNSRNEELESSGEKTSWKRLQNVPSITSMSPLKRQSAVPPTNNVNSTNSNVEQKATFSGRRRQSSIPNTKAPMGPRPLDNPFGKRSVSNTVTSPFSTVNGASAVASRDPNTHQLSINDISRFSFASISAQRASGHDNVRHSDPLEFGDFLPPINFDDFHNSITGNDSNLSNFPLPGGSGMISLSNGAEIQPFDHSDPPNAPPRRSSNQAVIFGRNNSTASTPTAKVPSKPEPMSTTTTSILRGRRQSNLPPNSFNNAIPKPPRKSVGPGTFVAPETPESGTVQRTPSVGGRKPSVENQKDKGLSVRLLNRAGGATEPSREGVFNRIAKTTSILSAAPSKDLLTPTRTPEQSRSSSTNVRTPSRPPASRRSTADRVVTPGNSTGDRRMSVIPSHATGLGARTISPTDARRMKRMSIMPPAPPLPHSRLSQAPPTPQPEPSILRPQSTAQSPAPLNRKSITPSSSRTTPDPNRKSYSSGQSLSSSTSYNSVRNSSAMPLRVPPIGLSSRLPTPKPRSEVVSVVSEEGVPPVPAIPKAFESPQSEQEQPFFSARSSSLPLGEIQTSESPNVFSDALSAINTPRAPSSSSRKSLGIPLDSEPRQQKPPSNAGRKSLQPLRLPPLNLLPLSTPTTEKIKALNEPTPERDGSPCTPPVHRVNAKTPSTPLTASKASFFSRIHRQSDDSQTLAIRSSTSHQGNLSTREDSQSPAVTTPNMPFFYDTTATQRNMSPFISSSLPKSSGEFANYMRPNFGSDPKRASTQARPSGPRAPSFSVTPKTAEKPSPVESESRFSAAALKRALSRNKTEPIVIEKTASFESMPPPKLPASATWSNFSAKESSPPQKPSYLKSRRKTSTSGSITLAQGGRHDSFSNAQSSVVEDGPLMESARSTLLHPNRSSSLQMGGQILKQGMQSSQAKQDNSGLDRDDMVAEEEMKKLASKRKDFESAAKELDKLQHRACPVDRMSPHMALQTANLNIFERGEVVDYPDVFFTGSDKAKKIIGDLATIDTNFGYDDERGDYNIVEGDHLAYRYEVVDLLGKGSFGQVVRCIDHKTGILVAVKIIRNKKRFHQQALVEVNILQKLREWDPNKKHNVVNFDQSFYFRGHLCISTDLLGMNLYEFIKAHDFRGFSLKLIRRFTKQLLNSLVLLHGKKVIHCDLKPENVLLAHPMHSEIKVIDFGSSCFENEKVYTYIQSRFYRSPEVILGMSYGMPIDMWSLGCILAELYTGYPIFPGENEQEQLACIMEVFGPPEKHLIEKSSRKKLFFDSMGKPRLTVSSKGRRRRPSSKELRQVLKCDDEAFLDFITRCLRWDPARRMSPQDAYNHEFVTGVKSSTLRKFHATTLNSPIRRMNSGAGGGPRPLPIPPVVGLRNGAPVVRAVDVTVMNSPNKAHPTRRQSNTNAMQANHLTAKRASHAAMQSSSSRGTMGQRTMSSRSDLAAAAAAASLVR